MHKLNHKDLKRQLRKQDLSDKRIGILLLLKGKLMNWMCAGILLYADESLLAQSYLD